MNRQGNANAGIASHAFGAIEGSSSSNEKFKGHDLFDDDGWWYVNEQGGMCGPYTSQQMFSFLATGFLPEELLVYPVLNGTSMVPAPLKFFKQYPDHIVTGFTHLGRDTSTSSTTKNSVVSRVQDTSSGSSYILPNSNQQAHAQLTNCNADLTFSDPRLSSGSMVDLQQPFSWEDKCWLYLDGYGKPAGPYSLRDLCYWHYHGYLHSSVMVHHFESKSSQFTLLSLMDAWNKQNSYSGLLLGNATTNLVGFVSKISEDIGSQLHDGIMKAARRLVLDETISNVVAGFMDTKKTEKQVKTDQGSKGFRSLSPCVEKIDAVAWERRSRVMQSAIVSCHNVSSSGSSANKYIEEPYALQYTKSVGGIENFQAIKTVVSRVLFDQCMQVLWNAVFYDPFVNYVHSWRRNRRWSSSSIEETTVLAEDAGFQKTAEIKSHARERSVPAEELNRPHGFQPRESSCCEFKEDILSSPRTSVSTQRIDGYKEGIFARVEEELFLASNAAFVDFVKTSVEEEAHFLTNCLKDSQLEEVSVEMSGQIDNAIGSGVCATSEKAQMLDRRQIRVDDSQGSLLQPAISLSKQSSFDFLGSSFSRLGTPASSTTNDLITDEPPPPGLSGSTFEPCVQTIKTSSLDQFNIPILTTRSSLKGSASRCEHCSFDFLGSAFKRLGTPRCNKTDDQRIDEPPPPGSESDKVVSVGDRKLGRLVLDVSIPKCRRFVFVAICRQKLHDDVLREWKSSLDDLLLLQLNQFGPHQEAAEESRNTNNVQLDSLMERSKSYNSSGPSDVFVFDKFTYSRRKNVPKLLEANRDSSPLGGNKVHLQPAKKTGKEKSSKNVSSTGALGTENKSCLENGSCVKERGSVSGTSKVRASGKRNLSKCQLVKSSSGQKLAKIALVSQSRLSISSQLFAY